MNTKKTTDMWATVAAVTMIALLLAVAAFAQSGATFRFFGPLSRVITPNGNSQKNNGTAIFCFDDPAGSGVTGNIFSLLGSAVATMGPVTPNPRLSGLRAPTACSPGSPARYLTWDGTLQRCRRPQRHLRLSDHGRTAVLYRNHHSGEISHEAFTLENSHETR